MRYDSDELVKLWREHAVLLRKYGAEQQAAVLEQCATEVEAERDRRQASRISLDQAVEFTGFSRSHLRRLWRSKAVRQAGTHGNPEFYITDLPRKAGYQVTDKILAGDEAEPVNSRLQVARAIVMGK